MFDPKSWTTPLFEQFEEPLSISFPGWHGGDTDLAPTARDLMSDIKNNYIICLNPEGWLGMDSSSPKCHPIMSSGQRYTVRTVPAGTWDAHWLAFYPTAIWTTPVFFENTAVHHLHPHQKFQCCGVSLCPNATQLDVVASCDRPLLNLKFYEDNALMSWTEQFERFANLLALLKKNEWVSFQTSRFWGTWLLLFAGYET